MVVQHNMQAMNANRMLGINTKQAAASTEKLSSGYKINRAADNAAGLAISEKMRKQIRGLEQASANAEDGISCVQTAEGALAEVQDMLQRMNELVVQAANGTNSVTDRGHIQDEIDQLVTEIDRVSETTKFNEIYLLKGDVEAGTTRRYITSYLLAPTKNDAAGIQAGQPNHKYNYTGGPNLYMADVKIKTSNGPVTADVVRKGDDITRYLEGTGNTAAGPVVADDVKGINTASYMAFASVRLDTATDLTGGSTPDTVAAARDLYLYDKGKGAVIKINKDEKMGRYLNDGLNRIADGYLLLADVATTTIGITDLLEVDQSFNRLYNADGEGVSGVGLNRYFDDNGKYRGGLFLTDEATVQGEIFPSDHAIAKGDATRDIATYTSQIRVEIPDDLEFDLHVGADSDNTNRIGVLIASMSSAGVGVDLLHSRRIGIVDEKGDNATDAIDVIAGALQVVSTQRSLIGAVQNRLEHTVRNLDNVVENTTQAESNIRDTDMAEEMVAYTNNNVLLQAGQSMLAQANQANQGILSLLG